MNASTRSISLVLLGSSLFLAGCRKAQDEENQDAAQGGGRGGYGRTGGFIPIPIGGFGRGGGTAPAPSAAPSARGGFGGIGGGSGSASS